MGRRRFLFGWAIRALAAAMLATGAVVAVGYLSARADPVVRRATVRLPGWPAGVAPVRAVLLADIHIGSATTDPARLAAVVAQVNALRPDLVLIAGDFVAGHDPVAGRGYARSLAAPLAGLRARLGVVAVLGNHDYWTAPDEVRRSLAAARITVLANEAVARGPVVLVGIDDGFTQRADVARSLAAAAPLRGARVVLTHTPDTAKGLPASAGALVLAGHTHCGQAVLPLIGSIPTRRYGNAIYDPRFECGAVRDGGRYVVVTGGIGASFPFRVGAPPDLWLLTLGP